MPNMTLTPQQLHGLHRIAIIGPSSAGKSTLAKALGKKLDLPVHHLDALMHLPDWEPRPRPEFKEAHDRVIVQPKWVVEGNYSFTMPQRLEQAELVIFVDPPILGGVVRFIRRTLQNWGQQRAESAAGCVDKLFPKRVWWDLVLVHMCWRYPCRNRPKYKNLVEQYALHKHIHLNSFKALQRFYQDYEISR